MVLLNLNLRFQLAFAPFLPLSPTKYADLLGNLIDIHDVDVYLVNTGWTGGKYGIGRRISLHYTREMVDQAISGKLKILNILKMIHLA